MLPEADKVSGDAERSSDDGTKSPSNRTTAQLSPTRQKQKSLYGEARCRTSALISNKHLSDFFGCAFIGQRSSAGSVTIGQPAFDDNQGERYCFLEEAMRRGSAIYDAS